MMPPEGSLVRVYRNLHKKCFSVKCNPYKMDHFFYCDSNEEIVNAKIVRVRLSEVIASENLT